MNPLGFIAFIFAAVGLALVLDARSKALAALNKPVERATLDDIDRQNVFGVVLALLGIAVVVVSLFTTGRLP